MGKKIIGLIEKVKVNGYEVIAKVDTGAARSSIDMNLAAKLKLGPVIGVKKVKSSLGNKRRLLVEAILEIKGLKIKAKLGLATRHKMKYPLLIGKSTLKKHFLIDPSK